MTSPQARKGANAERELARILAELTGWPVVRRLRTGAHVDCGDLDGLPDTTAEIKNYTDVLRAIREGLADLEAEQTAAGSTFGVVFVRRRGGDWLAVMDVARFVTLLREATAGEQVHDGHGARPDALPPTTSASRARQARALTRSTP